LDHKIQISISWTATIPYMGEIPQEKLTNVIPGHVEVCRNYNIWLIDWCLTPMLAAFQLYRDSHTNKFY